MLIDDEWNGLADLLANLIAKYASELGIDSMPDAVVTKNMAATLIFTKIAHLLFLRIADTIFGVKNKYHGFG